MLFLLLLLLLLLMLLLLLLLSRSRVDNDASTPTFKSNTTLAIISSQPDARYAEEVSQPVGCRARTQPTAGQGMHVVAMGSPKAIANYTLGGGLGSLLDTAAFFARGFH